MKNHYKNAKFFLNKNFKKIIIILNLILFIAVFSTIIYGKIVVYKINKDNQNKINNFCLNYSNNLDSNVFLDKKNYHPKWSILLVNYKTNVYLKWQLKILYDYNNPQDFELIIIDNSVDTAEENKLKNLISNYQKKFQNIKLVFYKPRNKTASGQHGEALEFAKRYITGKYLLVHDPDFFWLKKNYLNILENELQNNVVVGAPYIKMSPNFPSAFGCAYRYDKIKNISFEAYIEGNIDKSWYIFDKDIVYNLTSIFSNFTYDVGWQIRDQLIKDPQNLYLSFEQYPVGQDLLKILNVQDIDLYKSTGYVYFYKNKIIGFHLFKGSYIGNIKKDGIDPKLVISQKAFEIRDKIGELMYKQIGNNNHDFFDFYCKDFNK
jgi:hypothetical protein